ncbi:MAG: hypothetical protein J0H43_07345 [Actinobacteria bacterium]|nr:hypothetical protein [Actinomycetota bacterium]
MRRLGERLRADDRGSIIPLVPVLVLAMLLLGGLVIDGSRDLNARGEAQAYAEEAARVGATQINPNAPTLQLLPLDDVKSAVKTYCDSVISSHSAVKVCELDPDHPLTSAVTCGGRQADIVVNTVVKMEISTTFLGMAGISALTSGANAQARPYIGITAADAC